MTITPAFDYSSKGQVGPQATTPWKVLSQDSSPRNSATRHSSIDSENVMLQYEYQ